MKIELTAQHLADVVRQQVETEFVGPKEEFLATLEMTLIILPAQETDLQRAEELTTRTNQLNTTGRAYTCDELNHFRQSKQHRLLMARLEDKYGAYGHIGLALVECWKEVWTVKLLLMSCRVMTRGVGAVILNHIMRLAKNSSVRLRAEYLPYPLQIEWKMCQTAEVFKTSAVFPRKFGEDTICPMTGIG